MDPVTIEGTIEEISWIPERFVKGTYRASGTLGKDRVFPAHYAIELIDTVVENSVAERSAYTPYKSGERISVNINHERNDGYLKKGMRIKIHDYKITGDEGGTRYSFSRIECIEI